MNNQNHLQENISFMTIMIHFLGIMIQLGCIIQIVMSFLKYTQSLRGLVSSSQNKRFVLGNSGADYDSVFGAMIYAFFMTEQSHVLHLPLIDCPEDDIRLRFQINFVMQQYDIQKHHLLYTEMFQDLYTNDSNTFLLYDHNFRKQISHDRIVGIIDHHAITEQIQCPYVIEKLGSALTLLYYLYNPQLLSKFSESELPEKFEKYRSLIKHKLDPIVDYDKTIDDIIFYGISLDTFNFDPTQRGRWNSYDSHAKQTILQKIKPKLSIEEIFETKTSLEHSLSLSLEDHIRKDFKMIQYGKHTINYSVILMNPETFIQHYWDKVALVYHPQKMKVDVVYAFMFAYEDQHKNLMRSIIFGGESQDFMNTIENLLGTMNMKRYEDIAKWERWEDPSRTISRKLFDQRLKQFI